MLARVAGNRNAGPPEALLHPPCSATTAAAWRVPARRTSAASSRPSAASSAASALSSHPLPVATGPCLNAGAAYTANIRIAHKLSTTTNSARTHTCSHTEDRQSDTTSQYVVEATHSQLTLAPEPPFWSATARAAAGKTAVFPSLDLTAAGAVPAPMSASGVPGGGVTDNRSFAAARASPPTAVAAACGMTRAAWSAMVTAGARDCAKHRRSHGLHDLTPSNCHIRGPPYSAHEHWQGTSVNASVAHQRAVMLSSTSA